MALNGLCVLMCLLAIIHSLDRDYFLHFEENQRGRLGTEPNDTQEIELNAVQVIVMTSETFEESVSPSGSAASRYWMRSHSK